METEFSISYSLGDPLQIWSQIS